MTDTKKSRGRGRPRGFDEETAVETAEKLFHTRGYDSVGVAELGEAIGIAAPSLYAAFGSKLGLFERAVAAYEARYGGILAEFLDRDAPVAALMPAYLEEAARFYTRPGQPCGCMVLSGTWNSTDFEAIAVTARRMKAGRDRIRDRIARERPDDAERLADFTLAIMAGLSAMARQGIEQDRLIAAARAAAPVYA